MASEDNGLEEGPRTGRASQSYLSSKTIRFFNRGPIDEELLEQIELGKLEGVTFEGVVFKRNAPRGNVRHMFKKKTKAWTNKLWTVYSGDEKIIAELL